MTDDITPTAIRFRRSGRARLVRVAERAETWTTQSGTPMTAQPGDMIITAETGGDLRSVKPDSFAATYALVEGDVYERTGEVWARPAQPGERVMTQEGEDIAGEGQWRVTDDDGNSWFVPEDVFTAGYRPALNLEEAAAEVQAQTWAAETLAAFGITPEDTAVDIAAGREEAAITALLEDEHPWVCDELDIAAVDLAAEWTRRHPGITAAEVAALIEAGEIDPRTALCPPLFLWGRAHPHPGSPRQR